jgi:hypothetical protein
MRVDWVFEPTGPSSDGTAPTLGAFPAAAEPHIELMRRWARSAEFPTALRLAIGFVLTSETPDREHGYVELRQYVDGVPEGGATDFLYQVNRPRQSRAGLDGLFVNRLSKWSVGSYQRIGIVDGHPVAGTARQTHLRLEMDINTSPEYIGVIPNEQIDAVISDLLAGAAEVCERGSRP